MQSVLIRRLTEKDVPKVAAIHAEAFPRQGRSMEWIQSNARAFPRMRYYVAELDGELRGFVLWTEKSGFRQHVVLELEQIAVAARHQKQGIGESLIVKSLPDVAAQLTNRGATLKAVFVSTRTDNNAQRLYRKTLGAEVEATLPSLYSADEVIMVARDPLRSNSTPNTHARKSGARGLA
jgi:ribosomal protein S18 acetylase RimI-like enzyme